MIPEDPSQKMLVDILPPAFFWLWLPFGVSGQTKVWINLNQKKNPTRMLAGFREVVALVVGFSIW